MSGKLLFCKKPTEVASRYVAKNVNCVALPFISAVGFYYDDDAQRLSNAVNLCNVKTLSENIAIKGEKYYFNGVTTAKGIGIAIIDTGCSAHLDFLFPEKRLKTFEVVGKKVIECGYKDLNGHGTHVAGIIAGNGISCGYKITGIAPRCSLISVKAVGDDGEGKAIDILLAMQWIYDNRKKYGIRVLNLSLGAKIEEGVDPLKLGSEALVLSGITVVASAGNDGPKYDTLKSPAYSSRVLTVGGAKKYASGWNVAEFSSRGVKGSNKPDVIAPSVNVTSTNNDYGYSHITGTSVAAPIVSAVCARIIAKYPHYTPEQVKSEIMKSAVKVDCNRDTCGVGLIGESFITNEKQ